MIGDVHLGDWGLQMGLIITELQHRKPELVYFDETYGRISGRSTVYHQRAGRDLSDAPAESQKKMRLIKGSSGGNSSASEGQKRISCALETHSECICYRSEENYANLNVSFDLWKGESDAQPYIPPMVEK